MNSKRKNIIGSLILLIGLSFTVAIIAVAYNINGQNVKMFNKDKAAVGRKYYNNIKLLENSENYPKTPEEVMNIYADYYCLVYGKIIKDPNVLPEIVSLQRKLLSKEITDTTSFEEQIENLNSSLDTMKKGKMYIIFAETKSITYTEKNMKECTARFLLKGNDFSEFYWNYYLVLEDGNWKIRAWKAADKDFKNLS